MFCKLYSFDRQKKFIDLLHLRILAVKNYLTECQVEACAESLHKAVICQEKKQPYFGISLAIVWQYCAFTKNSCDFVLREGTVYCTGGQGTGNSLSRWTFVAVWEIHGLFCTGKLALLYCLCTFQKCSNSAGCLQAIFARYIYALHRCVARNVLSPHQLISQLINHSIRHYNWKSTAMNHWK